MAYQTPLTIAQVMQDISANKYVLPSILLLNIHKPQHLSTSFNVPYIWYNTGYRLHFLMLTGIHEKLSLYNIVPVCYNNRVDRDLPDLFTT